MKQYKILKSKKCNFLFSILFILFLSITNLKAETSSCVSCNASNCNDNYCIKKCDGYPYLQMRSQGRDSARQLVGTQDFINRYDAECDTYGVFSLTLDYSRSFRPKELTQYLFGNDLVNCRELYIQGSNVEDRNSKAWLADYLGLSPDFDSRVTFCPTIQNVVLDLNFYIGLDELTRGLFLKINAPLVWTKWELNACEKVLSKNEAGFEKYYMSEDAIERDSLANTFLQVMGGGYIFGDMQVPLKFGKISTCDTSTTRFAQMDFTLGYNFLLEEDRHFGITLYGSAPTGTRPGAAYLFEPTVGNGKHWEVGFGFTGSWIFWESDQCQDRFMGIWLDATVGHLLKTCQCRSFDFCNKPNSRYMLLEQMETADGNLTGPGSDYIPANYQYAQKIIPAINWSTFSIKTKINIQSDIAIKLGCTSDNWSMDLGYNFWARTGEKFSCATLQCTTHKKYAIKGNAVLYGSYITTQTIVPLSATESHATIHGPAITTNLLDNEQPAYYTDGDHKKLWHPTISTLDTSIQPILVSKSNLAISQSPNAITHKIFGYLGYAWKDRQNQTTNVPFIGIGGKVEFAQDDYKECCKNSCNNSDSCCDQYDQCKDHPKIGLSQWGLWIKGGVSFD